MTKHQDAMIEVTGCGSASDAPAVADDFSRMFHSYRVRAGNLWLHAAIGGEGPPLLLLAGWPQTWYAWRELMPALARSFTVVAADPRGVGLSDKPGNGYDTGTLAADMVALMHALGHERFAMVGHDVGMWTGYALAADHPERLTRLVLAEAIVPGLAPSPPLHMPRNAVDRLWHFAFNRLDSLNEQLVAGRERLFFGRQFETKAVRPLPDHAIDLYVETLASDREALRASFEPYRAIDVTIEQNARRAQRKLPMPVLTIAGDRSVGELAGATLEPVADDIASVVLPDCGHYPAEEAPQEMLAVLNEFLAPHDRIPVPESY